ncbi:DUF2288 domain-containing protein [Hydromonas duriensis]|uniref:DUF2288 family protein n=1 Tax=Hydromonas duriensis TaxID=1527608 RepID=A0A4R6Y779_9BURK|nr:DUF2288 domain-containing protein [Hydromonas duriensis]TDR31179.1 hypothetical protein DFR44_11248 [Hydromonas duriensis]
MPNPDLLPEELELLHAKLNLETAEMAWTDLQRFFAQGLVHVVAPELDLVDVAYAIGIDDAKRIKQWMDSGLFTAVSDNQAADWYHRQAVLWTVVVRPWILVQDKSGAPLNTVQH